MDDDRIEKGVLPGDGGKRTPPTIDLTASEVSESRAASESSSAAHDETAARETPAQQTDAETATAETHAASSADAASSSASAPPRQGRAGSVIVSAITGAVAAGLVVVGMKLAGWPAPPPVAPPIDVAARADLQTLATRLAKAEANITKPASSAADTELRTRLDALEKSVASLRDDVAAVRDESAKAVAAIADGKPASVLSAPSVDTSGLEERIDKVERAAAALSAAAAAPAPQPQPADDPKLRRVAAATLLDSSVRQGEPYGAALSAARAASDDAATLKPLDAFATTGVPGATALCRELLALLPQLAPKPAMTPAPSGIVERLQQSAAKLVRIQRTDAAPTGSDNGAIVARATAAARRDDVNEAKRELLQLAPSDRTPVQGWLAKADARDAALNAARQFAADAATALAQPAR